MVWFIYHETFQNTLYRSMCGWRWQNSWIKVTLPMILSIYLVLACCIKVCKVVYRLTIAWKLNHYIIVLPIPLSNNIASIKIEAWRLCTFERKRGEWLKMIGTMTLFIYFAHCAALLVKYPVDQRLHEKEIVLILNPAPTWQTILFIYFMYIKAEIERRQTCRESSV